MSTGDYFRDMSTETKIEKIAYLTGFCTWFEDVFDLPIYLLYGTLLGTIRENGFIDGDNDIDVAYLSKYNKFEDVFKEMIMINLICQNLDRICSFGQGKNLPKHSGHVHIYSEDKKCVFDVWTSWIDRKGKYNFYSMGKNLPADYLLPLGKGTLMDTLFNIPNNSSKLLEYLYSKDWKKPLNRKSYYYNKDYWNPLINIYKTKVLKIKRV